MGSLSQYLGGSAAAPVDGVIDGALYNKQSPLIDTGDAMYATMTHTQALRATTRAQRANWFKRAKKYMCFDGFATKAVTSGGGFNYAGFMYSCESFVLRVSDRGVMHSTDGVKWAHCEFEMPTANSMMWFGNNSTKIGRIGSTFYLWSTPDGGATNRIYRSTDGLYWTVAAQFYAPQGYAFTGFSSANNRLFVTFINNTNQFFISTSSDGDNWVQIPIPSNNTTVSYVSSVGWNGTNYCFAVGSSDTTYGNAVFSSNGLNWTNSTTAFSKLAYNGNTAVDITVFNNTFYYQYYDSSTGQYRIWSSPTGAVWTNSLNVGLAIGGLISTPSMLLMYGASSQIYTTTDGTAWTSRTFGAAGNNITTGVWDGSRFVLGTTNNIYRTSTDGITWVAGGTVLGQQANFFRSDGAVVYNGDTYFFTTYAVSRLSGSTVTVCVNGYLSTYVGAKTIAKNGNTIVYVNSTGAYTIDTSTLDHKTQLTLPGTCNSVCYGNGKFVAAGNGFMYWSTDGYTWNTVAVTGNNMCVAYGGGLYITIRANGSVAFSSPDAITWTQRTLIYNVGTTSAIQYASGFWVIYQPGAANPQTSYDGITWTGPQGGLPGQLRLVQVGNKHIIASGTNGATSYLILSPITMQPFLTDSTYNSSTFAQNTKLDQIVDYVMGTAGNSNDQCYSKATYLAETVNNWTTGGYGNTFSASPYSLFWSSGSSSYNLNPSGYGAAFTQIPGTASMLMVTGQRQALFVDGGHANLSFTATFDVNNTDFIVWNQTYRICDPQVVWTDDGSCYMATGNFTSQPILGRFQLGVLYTNPHYNTSSTGQYQSRRVG